MSVSGKWDKEKKAVKAVQMAFDLGQDLAHQIRLEALEKGINPPDRIRELLDLPVNSKPIRPRLSISLSEDDFLRLGKKFAVDAEDKLKIRQLAAEVLVDYLESTSSEALET